MKYVVPLLIKFFIIFFVLGIILWMFDVSFTNILLLTVLVTAISLVGDMIILPRYGNVVATIVDFGIVLLVVLLGSTFLFGNGEGIGWAAITPAIIIALGEVFLHKFLLKQFFEDVHFAIDETYEKIDGEVQFGQAELAHLKTEFSNEFDIGNPEGKPGVEEEKNEKKKSYVPHRRRNRHKKNSY